MKIAWESIQNEALDTLRALVRLDTSNPPGNELIAADFIAAILGSHGLDSIIRQSAPTRANLVARLAGRDRGKPALLLSSHTDVVPVEREGWTREPFSGEIYQGCVWGRGTIDMKSKGAMDVALVTALKRTGAIPECDIILAAVADEEAGSDLGAKFLVERHPELVRSGWVLNEVGGFTLHVGKRRLYPIQVAEKGFVTVKMIVTAPPGHGSMPRRDTAISKISALITKIVNTPMKRRVTPLMSRTLAELKLPEEDPGPLLRPMLANTVTPTILRAGYKDNVIPGEASVVLDGRTLPGQDPESFMAELRAIVGPEPRFELIKTAPPAETSPDTELFELIRRKVEAADPGAHAIPWMTPGATDNKFYARLGSQCYGFSPVRLEAHMPFGSLFHGNDERLPIEGFLWGLKVYAEVVMEFVGLRFHDIFS